ncbi:MFS transporter [Lachnospiraceae bacterium 48-21]
MKTDMNPNARLSFMERFAYGIGDYSGNLIYSSISAFLLVYYVSVTKMDAGQAASVIAISKIFDGISDLVMGTIVDNTHSKWGKARPWLLRLCVPLAVCTVLMFSVPASLTGGLKFAYAFLTYNLVSTIFYTGINVPYATLNCLMTTNQYERGLLGNFRMLLATAGTMTVNSFVMKMCSFFGNGDEYAQRGWTVTYIILAAVFVILNLVTFWFCKERVVEESGMKEEKAGKVNPVTAFKSLIKNKYWLLMVVFLFSLYFMMSAFFGSGFYFAQYVVGNGDTYASISNFLSMSQIAAMFVTPFIMRKLSKRYLAMMGMCLSTAGFLLTALAGSNVAMLLGCSVLKGIGFGCCGASMWGLLQDAITYGEWLTGISAAGMGNAASSFCMKIGSGIGTAALGWILAAGNFNTDPTSASAITSLNISFIWVPVITCLIGVVCMAFFDLDKYYAKAVTDLGEGKYKNK